VATAASAQPLAYRHAYYLFLADTPTGCELLRPVAARARAARRPRRRGQRVVVITTYERDSIWSSEKAVR